MTISTGDRIPDVELLKAEGGGTPVRTSEVLGQGRVVLFAVPGAFTPTCSDAHLPGFVLRAADLKGKGVDTVACVAMNDAFVLAAWGDAQGVGEDVVMLSDGTGSFTRAMGMEIEIGAAHGLGTRSKRYAAVIEDGVVTWLGVEASPGDHEASSADSVLAAL
ncbi:MAG: peroxiredoxin [Acidimicrobiales bacterium]